MKKAHVRAIGLGLFIFASIMLIAGPADAASVVVPGGLETLSNGVPVALYIPAIKLYSPIQGVGVNAKGNMDVPSGRSNNVGWYKYGVIPGNAGTAVLDAHNTAAFKTLNKVPVGSDIYVYTSTGKVLHFQATKAETYSMATLQSSTLFEPFNRSSQRLNLITCAGTLLGNGEATERLIVSAQLL